MRKVAAVLAVVTMSAGVLTACSGGDYCGELKAYAESVKDLKIDDAAAVEKMRDEAKKVSKSAPDDLKDDWKVLIDFSDKAVEAKGDQAKLAELAKNEGEKMGPASKAIGDHAKNTCKVTIES